MAPIVLLVDFLADGRCFVHTGRARMSATVAHDVNSGRPGDARADPGASNIALGESGATQAAEVPAGAGFHCPIPYASVGSDPVALRVVLPPGVDRSADAFPRLEWHTEGPRWIGSASLPASPAFVSLHRWTIAPASGVPFGWNFYGFFVFAALFIALYFGWARRMQQRAPSAVR